MTHCTTLPHSASDPIIQGRIGGVRSDRFSPGQAQSGFLTMHGGVSIGVTPSTEVTFRWPKMAQTLVAGIVAYAAGADELLVVDAAERRLAQIQADVRAPRFFEDDEDSPQLLISDWAVEQARALIRSYASLMFGSTRHISIFAMPNGGLQLQSTGANSAVSIEIPPNVGEPILAEFASDDEYHSRSMHDDFAAAQFLALAMR